MIEVAERAKAVAYSPSSIVNIFNNALSNDATRKMISVKGVYVKGKGISYNGYYYDQLKEESNDACITLIVPALIRTMLHPQQMIECTAYLTKKVQSNGAKIELQLNVTELLSQQESQFTEEQVKSLQIIKRKADAGYRDVDSFVKKKIILAEPVRIIILVGKGGIIHSDIKHQLGEAISFYDFQFVGINLSSENEIIAALQGYHEQADVLVVSRGGGENMGIFNKPSIAEVVIGLQAHFITAIGHKEDNSLLQQVADKAFITPTALAQYFNDIYSQTIDELQNSKAVLVENITRQLQANYEHQIKNLKDQADNTSTQHQNKIVELQQLLEKEIKHSNETAKKIVLYWIWIVVSIIVGIIIGKGCN